MKTLCRINRIEKTREFVPFFWQLGALITLVAANVANAQPAPQTSVKPELVPQLALYSGGILLAPRAELGAGEPRARLLNQGDSQTYGNVVQWRDPQSGAVLKTMPLAAQPSTGDLSSSPVSTALSPQGDILANVGPENVLFWQNAWSGAILQSFPRQSYPLAFASSGRKFVSQQVGNEEKPQFSLVVRDVPQGRVLHKLELPQRASRVVWSPDATRLCAIAVADKKQDVRVWDAASGQLQWQAQNEAANFLRAWFLPDGRLAILDSIKSGGATLRVRVWPIKGGEPTVTAHDYNSDAGVRWAVRDDGGLLISVVRWIGRTKTRLNFVWGVPQMAPPRLVAANEAGLIAGAHWQGQYYRPSLPFASKVPVPVALKLASLVPGRVLVADDSRVWEATTGQLRGAFQPVPPRASALAIAPDGKFFASAGGGGGGSSGGAFLGVWESATQELLWHKAVSLTRNNGGPYAEAGSAWATSLAFSPDAGRLLVASALDQPPLALYETRSGKLLWSTKRSGTAGIGFDAKDAALSDDGTLIAVTSSELKSFFKAQVQIVNAADGTQRDSWKVPTPISDLSWSRDKSFIALATANGQVVKNEGYSFFKADEYVVELRAARTGEVQRTLRGPKSWVRALRFSPDGESLAGVANDGAIYLWNARSGQLIRTLKGEMTGTRDVAWNGNSQLVSVGEDGAARFWNVSQGQLLATALWMQTRASDDAIGYPNAGKKGFGGGLFGNFLPVEWVIFTPEGFYHASPDAEKYLRWRVGTQLFPAAKFKSRFHQPARVRAALTSTQTH